MTFKIETQVINRMQDVFNSNYLTCVTSVFSMSRDNVTLASYLSVLDNVVVSLSVFTYFTLSSGTPAMFADSLLLTLLHSYTKMMMIMMMIMMMDLVELPR